MKTAANALLLVITGLLGLPVNGAPADLPHQARTDYIPLELKYDCDMVSDGLVAGCDIVGNYFTCTNNIVTIFSCNGGCQVVGNGDEPRCNNGVVVAQGTY